MRQFRLQHLILAAVLICLAVCGAAAYIFLNPPERLYGGKSWSPNREYYMQMSQTMNFINPPAMPGQGSDNINGYVRIYDKNGKRLHSKYFLFIRETKVLWHKNEVYLMGGVDMDDEIWYLPSSAE